MTKAEKAAAKAKLTEDAKALVAATDPGVQSPPPPAEQPAPPTLQQQQQTPDDQNPPPVPVNRMVTVCAKRHLNEEGHAYAPGMKFRTTEERAKGLGALVDIVPNAAEKPAAS
jgi:hypothetical protein